MNYLMTDVIATRRLPWRRTDGTQATIEVCIGLPAPLSHNRQTADWYCPYQIKRWEEITTDETAASGSTGEMLVQHKAFGADAIQALYLALGAVGVEIGTLAGTPDEDWANLPNFGFPTLPHPK